MASEYDSLLEEAPQSSEYDALLAPEPQESSGVGEIAGNIGRAAWETVKGFVPTSLEQARDLAVSLVPPLQAAKSTYGTLSAIVHGESPLEPITHGVPVAQRIPEIAVAEKTAPFSQERFQAGFGTLADVAMLAGIGHGIAKGVPKTITEVVKGVEEPIAPEVAPVEPQPMPAVEPVKAEPVAAEPIAQPVPEAVAEPVLGKQEPVSPTTATGTGEAEIHPRFQIIGSRGRGEATPTSDYDLVTALTPEEHVKWVNTPEGEYPVIPQEIKDAANAGHDVFIKTGEQAWKVEPHPVSEDPNHVVVERVSQIEKNLLSGGRKPSPVSVPTETTKVSGIEEAKVAPEAVGTGEVRRPATQEEINARLEAEHQTFQSALSNYEKVTGEPPKHWEIPMIRYNPEVAPEIIKAATNRRLGEPSVPDIDLGDGRIRKDGFWTYDAGEMGRNNVTDPNTQAQWDIDAATIGQKPTPVPSAAEATTAQPLPETIVATERPIGSTAFELLNEMDKASERGDSVAVHMLKRTIERLPEAEREAGVDLRLSERKPIEEVIPSAIEEGKIGESVQAERPGDGEGGTPAETGRGSGVQPEAEILTPKEGEVAPVPPEQIPAVEPTTAPLPQKPSKIGQSIEAKAVEAKLTQGFAETAGYDPLTIADQSQRATDLVKASVPQARAIIRGEAPLPEGLRGTSLITAMEEQLLKNPDPRVAHELANSPLTSATSAAAQEMRLMRERVPDSLAAKFQEIREARQAGAKLRGEAPETVYADITKEVMKQASKRPTWEAFVREIVC